MEFESPACTLSWRNRHTLVEVGCGLQVISGLLLQLLAELLSLYCSNVSYTGKETRFVEYQNKENTLCMFVYKYWISVSMYVPLSVGMRCVSSTSLPLASTVLPFSSRIRGVGLFTSLGSTLL